MNRLFIILKHTFLTNLRKKSFIVTTIVTTLLLILVLNLPAILATFVGEDIQTVGVVDETHLVYEQIKDEMSIYKDIVLESFPNEEAARAAYETENINSYILIDLTANELIVAEYKAENILNVELISYLEQALSTIQFQKSAEKLDLTPTEIANLFAPVQLTKTSLSEGAKSEAEIAMSYVIVYILLIAIYFGVVMYGNMIAMEVAKEKSSRVMEILISSVNPVKQMFGKILGILLLGVFQIALMLIIGFFSLRASSGVFAIDSFTIDFSELPTHVFFYAVLFYILGNLFYATFAAMLGSLVSRIEDLQQTIGVLNFILIAAFIIAMFGLTSPDSTVIKVLSYIPFFTPMVMFLRIGMTDPHVIEIIISVAIMVVSIIASSVFAARVYKGGVLLYGKGTSLKDIRRALQFK